MYEPLTVAKVVKETKITVPAGGWVLVMGPDQPLHQHIAARTELIKDGAINDDYETLLIGRLQDTHNKINFVTKAGASAALKAKEKSEKAIAKNAEETAALVKKQAEEKAAAEAEAHAVKIKAINEANDAIRNRK